MRRKKKLTAKSVNALKAEPKKYRVWDTEITGFHVRVSPRGRKAYALAYRHNGVPKEYTIDVHGKVTADGARIIAKKMAGKVADGVDIQVEKKAKQRLAKIQRYHTLKAFIEKKYEPWALANLKTGKEAVRSLKVDFAKFLPKKLKEITPWLVEGWIREARKQGTAPSSINRRVAVLKSALSKAAEWGVIDVSPIKGMSQLKTDKLAKIRFLSEDEEGRLRAALEARQQEQREGRDRYNQWRKARRKPPLRALDGAYTDHLAPIVLFGLNTGLRRGEIFGLHWKNVNLKGRIVTVEGPGAKSGQTRHIPLNDEAFAVLVAWRNQTDSEDLVFPSPDTGDQLDNIDTAWSGTISTAKLKDFRFHDLRHSFASKLVMAGADLNTVRELLGHAMIDMTLRYAHLAPEHKAAAVALLNKKD